MHSVSPEPSIQGHGCENGGDGGEVKAKQSRRAHLRSRVAANFNLHNGGQEGDSSAAARDNVERAEGGKEREVCMTNERKKVAGLEQESSHSNKRPPIPHLDIAGSDPQRTTQDPARDVSTQPNPHHNARLGEGTKGQNETSERHPSPAVLQESAQGGALSAGEHIQESGKPTGEWEGEQVRSLLERKKEDLSRSRLEAWERAHSEVEARERKQLEREQRRAAKMRADRKAAIEELRKRREERLLLQERLAQEELVRREGGRARCR